MIPILITLHMEAENWCADTTNVLTALLLTKYALLIALFDITRGSELERTLSNILLVLNIGILMYSLAEIGAAAYGFYRAPRHKSLAFVIASNCVRVLSTVAAIAYTSNVLTGNEKTKDHKSFLSWKSSVLTLSSLSLAMNVGSVIWLGIRSSERLRATEKTLKIN
jgi:hypothetical protein